MGFCKRFLEEIRQINFAESAGSAVHRLVLASASQDLDEQRPRLVERIAQLPLNIPSDEAADAQLQAYRQKLAMDLERLDKAKDAIATSAEEANIVLGGEINIDDTFIQDFSSYFRDLKHLAETLSDAPSILKAHQTSLYLSILSKLQPREQEHQLQILSGSQISDLLTHAIRTFDGAKDPTLRHQCQRIVQMACFELVSRHVHRLDPQPYQDLLKILIHQLPEVHQSEILDNLSQYQNTEGLSIGALLFQAQAGLNIPDSAPWSDELSLTSAIKTRELCHKLRFGQDDRREYVSKRQDNMARDLFWARNIRDIELFTKSGFAEDTFQSLALKKYLATPNPYQKPKTKFEGVDGQLERAFISVKNARKTDSSLPSGDRTHRLDAVSRQKYIQLIQTYLSDVANHPTVQQNKEGQLSIDFIRFDTNKEFVGKLLDIIIANGGFGQNADTMVLKMQEQLAIEGHVQYRVVVGDSLAQIRKKLAEEDGAWKPEPAFSERILQAIEQAVGGEISSLGLNNSEELLLRQSLELYYFYQHQQAAPASLEATFALISQGEYRQVLTSATLQQVVDESYQVIAGLKIANLPKALRPIVAKAQMIGDSARERQEKLEALQQGLKALDVDKISAVFFEEYQAMEVTLGLTGADEERLAKDIRLMAEDLVKLIDRTQQGLPVLTEDEKEAYFTALHDIARLLHPKNMTDVQFKIPHSALGDVPIEAVFADGARQVLKIQLPKALPYSLIKPPGDAECVFSYGGSRGVIAPFAGLDEAYAGLGKQKARLFTHSRLLGVGQYGVVKEVEGLVTSLNQVIKKGFIADGDSTFTEASRMDLRTRPISARNDPLYRQESTILQALSKAREKSKATLKNGTQFWLKDDKERVKGRLFAKDGTPRQYQILTDRAQGDTFADTANRRLNQYSKGDEAYHNPCLGDQIGPIKEMLALSEALVVEAEHFQALGFSHNDIKPENFLSIRRADGRYDVRYIDWATGGFSIPYDGQQTELMAIFAEVFGQDLTAVARAPNDVRDNQGRFVRTDEKGLVSYGIHPQLEILHGARNGTVPYISPQVLGEDRTKQTVTAGGYDPRLDTKLTATDPMMDDWALTAMTFGVCNRQAYFALAKGRVVGDYVIPGIIEADGQDPLGLKVIDVKKFNAYFAPETVDAVTDAELASGAIYSKQDAVMFIPSNQREGEPIHLYRRLLALKASLSQIDEADPLKWSLKKDIDNVLKQVHLAIANGKGLSRAELRRTLNLADMCIKNYEQLNDQSFQKAQQQGAVLEAVIAKYQHKAHVKARDLLQDADEGVSELRVLCTYPKTDATLASSIALLNQTFDHETFNDTCIQQDAPYRELLTESLASQNPEIVACLLAKVDRVNPDFIKLVREQGLFHHALQEGFTDVAMALINALIRAGASEQIFDLLLLEYGPGQNQISGQPEIKWAINALKIAIQNGSKEQLSIILNLLPKGQAYDDAISAALHLSAVYSQVPLFTLIQAQYNRINPERPLTSDRILKMVYAPDDSSPYHLFLRDEATLDAIDWDALKASPSLGSSFLFDDPSGSAHAYPLLVSLKHNNLAGLQSLIKLGVAIRLTPSQWQSFYKQTDASGKNILNYFLEHGHHDELAGLLQTIRDSAGEGAEDVMLYLMSNIHPVNPLRNFLATTTAIVDKFAVLHTLLDALCNDAHHASEEAQRARITALLVNKEWLIERAEDVGHHAALRQLLQNDALSNAFKQVLFKELTDNSLNSPIGHGFYHDLLKEISPHLLERDRTYIGLQQPIIDNAVSLVRDDMTALMASFTKEIDALKQELSRTALSIGDLRSQLLEKEQSARAQAALVDEAQQRLEATDGDVERLQQEAELAERRYQQALMGLRQQLARSKDDSAAELRDMQGELQLLRGTHREELRTLQEVSGNLTRERDVLAQKLQESQAELHGAQLEIAQLQEALHASDDAMSTLSAAKDVLEAKIAHIEQLHQEALQENAALSATLQERAVEMTQLQASALQLGHENEQTKARLAEVIEESVLLRRRFEDDIQSQGSEIVLLKQQLAEATSERASLTQSLSENQVALAGTQETVTKLRQELQTLSADHQALHLQLVSDKDASRTDLLGLRAQLQQQSDIAREATQLAQTLQERLGRAIEDNERQQASAEALSQINLDLEAVLHARDESIQPPARPPVAELPQAPDHLPQRARQVIRRPLEVARQPLPPVEDEVKPNPVNQSWMKIYSLLYREGDEQRYSNNVLFKNTEQGVLITINFAVQQLTLDEAKHFISSTGLNVRSPSGQSYSMNYNDNVPRAVLAQKGAQKRAGESDEEYQQRLATTIINMLDNVLSKGVIANVHTEDPFIAKIAELYLVHLKTKVGLSIAYSEVTGCEASRGDAKPAEAQAIFNKLQEQLSKERIESAPWYKDALKVRQEPPEPYPLTDGGPSLDR